MSSLSPPASTPTAFSDLDPLPLAHHGGYTNIYLDSIEQFAFKVFRVVPTDVDAVSRVHTIMQILLLQQAQIDILNQRRISPIWFVNAKLAGNLVPAIVVRWYRQGNVLAYLRCNPNVNKLDLVIDVACGLAGLHSIGIPHGNLYPGNVIIMDGGLACITDVGVYTMQTTHGHRAPIPAQWQYKSPDELRNGICTLPDDVYSFACTTYSIYAGGCPIECSARVPSTRAIQQIIERGHCVLLSKSKPAALDGALWEVLGRCWALNPASRPTMKEIESELRALKASQDLRRN